MFQSMQNPTKPTEEVGPVVNPTTACFLQPYKPADKLPGKTLSLFSLPQRGKLLHPRGTKKATKGYTRALEEFEELGFTVH